MSNNFLSKHKGKGTPVVSPKKASLAKKGKMEKEMADNIEALLKLAMEGQGCIIGKSI